VLIGKDLREDVEVDIGDRLIVKTPEGKETHFIISGFL